MVNLRMAPWLSFSKGQGSRGTPEVGGGLETKRSLECSAQGVGHAVQSFITYLPWMLWVGG